MRLLFGGRVAAAGSCSQLAACSLGARPAGRAQRLDASMTSQARSHVTSGSNHILEQELHQLEQDLLALGEPVYRARQVWRWIYHRLAASFAEMTDLPRALRDRLAERYTFAGLQALAHQVSEDQQTRKVLFELADGQRIETVLMLYDATDVTKGRRTLCLSTQAGCALGCTFCATGLGGLQRNLTTGEIVGQALHYARFLATSGQGEEAVADLSLPARPYLPITNIIFAGMGEPLANYDATLAAIRRLNDADGFGLGARHMVVSTAGLAPGINRLATEGLQVNLAVSLHAPTDELRSRIMPINRRYPLAELMNACRAYVMTTGRRISFEYILIEGVNASIAAARQLAALLQGITCMVNLIPMNPVAGIAYAAPRRETVVAFMATLNAAGVTTTVRIEKGREIQAACGQLRGALAAAEQ